VFLKMFSAVLSLDDSQIRHTEPLGGSGEFQTQVRVMSPDGKEVAFSGLSTFRIEPDGYADNVTFFVNVSLDRAGTYSIQTYLDGKAIAESHSTTWSTVSVDVELMSPQQPIRRVVTQALRDLRHSGTLLPG
jgi:hypothetical protein